MLGKFFKHPGYEETFMVCGKNEQENCWISIGVSKEGYGDPTWMGTTGRHATMGFLNIDRDITELLEYARKEQSISANTFVRGATIMENPKPSLTLGTLFRHHEEGTIYMICGESKEKDYWISVSIDDAGRPLNIWRTNKLSKCLSLICH